MTLSSHQRPVRGETDVWLTPPEIIKAVGPFDLDPCAAVNQPWTTAAKHHTIDDDGLAQEWAGFVWCNPPFGPDAEKWLERLAKHGHGIGLVPARTETRWFVRTVWESADAVLFLRGRPHFHHADGTRGRANSGAPICLIGYGRSRRSTTDGLPPRRVSRYTLEDDACCLRAGEAETAVDEVRIDRRRLCGDPLQAPRQRHHRGDGEARRDGAVRAVGG